MSNERFNGPYGPGSMQGLFSQVIREIQNGLNRLEQAVQQGTPPAAGDGGVSDFQPQTPPPPPGGPVPSPAPAPAPAPEAPWSGQRWEYKVVYVNFRGQISADGQQTTIERGERRSSFVRRYLDQLGEHGWELSGVSPLGETENSYLIFKRAATGQPKPQPTPSSVPNATKVQVEEINDDTELL